ncbi:MAG: VOC family protein [Dehalococcoidia bacterium]|nr:VOC family protein [Dehalococcoidia bacterium]MSQ16272.1 VOC family protein [Dehalococcoidia bacterium]
MPNNAITWFSMPTANFDRAVKFYSAILGEAVQVQEFMGKKLGLFPMDGAPGSVGGALLPPDSGMKVSSEGTRVFLNCQGKLDAVAGRVEQSGGKIVQPKFSIGEDGQIVIIQDSEGNTVGLHSH